MPIWRPATVEADWTDGRDELNLAGFTLTLLSERPPAGGEMLKYTG